MACTPLTSGACEHILRGIELLNGQNNTSFNYTPVGTLQAVMSNENRADASFEEVNERSGSIRKVRIVRIPRATKSDANNNVSCATTTTTTFQEECIEAKKFARISWDMSKEEMQSFCEDSLKIEKGGAISGLYKRFMEVIYSKMNGLRTYLNFDLMSTTWTNAGTNAATGNTNVVPLPFITAADGSKIEKGIQTIISHYYSFNNLKGKPFIIGTGVFDNFNTSADYGCCNQYGFNWSLMKENAPYNYYLDVDTLSAFTNIDNFMVLAPGAVQLVTYNDFVIDSYLQGGRPLSSLSENKFGTSRKGIIPDPLVPNLFYDLKITEIDCDSNVNSGMETWRFSLYLHYGISTIPTGVDSPYGPLDLLYGTNGILRYTAQAV